MYYLVLFRLDWFSSSSRNGDDDDGGGGDVMRGAILTLKLSRCDTSEIPYLKANFYVRYALLETRD